MISALTPARASHIQCVHLYLPVHAHNPEKPWHAAEAVHVELHWHEWQVYVPDTFQNHSRISEKVSLFFLSRYRNKQEKQWGVDLEDHTPTCSLWQRSETNKWQDFPDTVLQCTLSLGLWLRLQSYWLQSFSPYEFLKMGECLSHEGRCRRFLLKSVELMDWCATGEYTSYTSWREWL